MRVIQELALAFQKLHVIHGVVFCACVPKSQRFGPKYCLKRCCLNFGHLIPFPLHKRHFGAAICGCDLTSQRLRLGVGNIYYKLFKTGLGLAIRICVSKPTKGHKMIVNCRFAIVSSTYRSMGHVLLSSCNLTKE